MWNKLRKNRFLSNAILIILIAVIFFGMKPPLYYQARSYIAMYAFSKYEEKNSLLAKQGFEIKIPGGLTTKERDWYPFVMVFNDDKGFSQYMGRDLSMTVLYNFGAFAWNKRYSDFFHQDSPYYNSFYGGYLVKENSKFSAEANKKYGFTAKGDIDIAEVFSVPEYDFKHLVIESLACPTNLLALEIISYELKENVEFAGYGDWIQIDALLKGNQPKHRVRELQRAYIQYGYPPDPDGLDFELMETYGRIYIRYAKELQCTLFLYILSPDLNTIKKCDAEILSKTRISSQSF